MSIIHQPKHALYVPVSMVRVMTPQQYQGNKRLVPKVRVMTPQHYKGCLPPRASQDRMGWMAPDPFLHWLPIDPMLNAVLRGPGLEPSWTPSTGSEMFAGVLTEANLLVL